MAKRKPKQMPLKKPIQNQKTDWPSLLLEIWIGLFAAFYLLFPGTAGYRDISSAKTYTFFALERFLKLRCGKRLGLKGLQSSRPYYMQFTMQVTEAEFFEIVREEAAIPFDALELVYPGEVPVFEKYDEYVPEELVRKGFAYGVLDVEGMKRRIADWK